MGENYALAGFSSVEEMVTETMESEDQQLSAVGNFLANSKLKNFLGTHDWTSYARGYNGPNYAINRYDVRLNAEFQKFSAGVLPDLNVRAAQLYLTYLGFHPGPIDGIAGELTVSAMAEFVAQNGIQSSLVIDANLRPALGRVNVIAGTAK